MSKVECMRKEREETGGRKVGAKDRNIAERTLVYAGNCFDRSAWAM